MAKELTDLFDAVTKNDLETLGNLMQSGADLTVKDKLGYTVLHKAVIQDNLDLVTLFIEHDKNLINIKDNFGRTAAHWAVFMSQSSSKPNCIDILKVLIHKDANLKTRNYDGQTVLHKAVIQDNLNLVTLFIEHDKNLINIKDNIGQTAAYLAAFNIKSSRNINSKEIIRLLIQNDADLEVVNQFNQSTMDILIENQDEELLELAFQQAELKNNPPVIPMSNELPVKQIEISEQTALIINTTCNQDEASRPIETKDEPEAITYHEAHQKPVSLWDKIFSLSWLKSLWSSDFQNRETTLQDGASRPIETKNEPEEITYPEPLHEPVSLWGKIFSLSWLKSLWSSESVADQIQPTSISLHTIGDDDAHPTSTPPLSSGNAFPSSEYPLLIEN
jgi:ankyrin repeat protein